MIMVIVAVTATAATATAFSILRLSPKVKYHLVIYNFSSQMNVSFFCNCLARFLGGCTPILTPICLLEIASAYFYDKSQVPENITTISPVYDNFK